MVEECGGGIRWEEVPVSEGRFVHVCDGLNAEVQADPSNRQSNVLRVLVRASRCCILQWMLTCSSKNGNVEDAATGSGGEPASAGRDRKFVFLSLFARYMNRGNHQQTRKYCVPVV